MTPFTISFDHSHYDDCLIGLIVSKSSRDGEYDITLLNCSSDKQQKHNLHSLSQIALYQFEDQEIDVHPVNGPCRIIGETFSYEVAEALILVQGNDNRIAIYAHPAVSVKKALDNAYRYCTRWIRLDI